MKDKKWKRNKHWLLLLPILILGISGCSSSKPEVKNTGTSPLDKKTFENEGDNVIYFAGGCFGESNI